MNIRERPASQLPLPDRKDGESAQFSDQSSVEGIVGIKVASRIASSFKVLPSSLWSVSVVAYNIIHAISYHVVL